ncbi:hypothetical protein FACS189467_7900 [Bacteroidia bacterium]|nr:hypothetical protein FACS189467_7900 [Bacteroidia bacterium]
MARIEANNLEHNVETKRRSPRLHDFVEKTDWFSFSIGDGKKYVQISTYGKATRAKTGEVSQSIQLDEKAAKKLVDILKKEFNL